MASSTGIPARSEAGRPEPSDAEPLLGRPGDVLQRRNTSFARNFVMGTASLAQLGAILGLVLVWASVFNKPLILFSAHPLLQSLAVFVLIQSVLSLQPTHTSEQKRLGQLVHASLNLLALCLLIAGVTIIEYNKVSSGGPHFHSFHGYLGVIVSIVLLIQYVVGFTMWAVPALYGGEVRARAVWKYHRYSGYLVLLLLLVTVCSAADTDYNRNVLHMKLWAAILASALVVLGVFPRIQKYKLGLGLPAQSRESAR
ncbi:hypothetical protein L249_2306 [Ophiocordyceps polyrhachis-furcata BCC 54312]|uniref:Cytochrome b561 domain-containing protein n=1 Tax=Ophiocordyceps polyrhachis-furcata BCC 54312 TaxID=1330021 RepID=A0A367LRE5_9HYPO|nr:hypothetical protein L249_2306 [Ophiocordyceps polyrhachis-furcata BCC 54312]